MDVDAALQNVGGFGPLQKANFFLCSLATLLAPIHMIGPALSVGQPDGYRCRPPPGFTLNETVPYLGGDADEDTYDSCHLYRVRNGSVTSELTTCLHGWEYESTHGETSVVTDLDLVCEKRLLGGTIQSISYIGCLLGSLILGQMSDTYGRRKSLICSLLGLGVCGTVVSCAWNYYLIAALFFGVGFWLGGTVVISYVLAIEMCTTDRRMKGHVVNGIMYGTGVLLVGPLAYVFPNWRHFQLAISLPSFLLLPFIMWLVQKGRFEEAEKIIARFAKSNKVPYSKVLSVHDETKDFPLEDVSCIDRESSDATDHRNGYAKVQNGKLPSTVSMIEKSNHGMRDRKRLYSTFHLFTTKKMAARTLILFLCWFTANCVYFGSVINTSNLAGHKYLNFFLIALLELTCYPIDYFVMKRFGRKRPLMAYFVGSAIACTVVAFTPVKIGSGVSLVVVIVAFSMLGRYFVGGVFNIVFLISAEVFPTVLRNIGLGACFTVGRIGAVISPFLVHLNTVAEWVPLTIFGAVSLVAGLLVSLLPETRHTHLPETISDGAQLATPKPPPAHV